MQTCSDCDLIDTHLLFALPCCFGAVIIVQADGFNWVVRISHPRFPQCSSNQRRQTSWLSRTKQPSPGKLFPPLIQQQFSYLSKSKAAKTTIGFCLFHHNADCHVRIRDVDCAVYRSLHLFQFLTSFFCSVPFPSVPDRRRDQVESPVVSEIVTKVVLPRL